MATKRLITTSVLLSELVLVPVLLLVRNNWISAQLLKIVSASLSEIPCASSEEYRGVCMCVQALTFTLTEPSQSKF